MLKQIILSLVISSAAISASAEDVKPAAPAAEKPMHHGDYKKFDQAEWDKMTKAEKVKRLEENRATRLKKSEEKWKKMSDDEKISQYEKRRAKFAKMREKKGAPTAPAAQGTAPAKPAEQPKPMPAKS